MNDITEAERVSVHSTIEAAFELRWESPLSRHTERYHFPKLNVWRDLELLPQEIQSQVLGRPRGHSGRHGFGAGALVPAWSEANLVWVKQGQFDRNWRPNMQIEPRLGRFYPRSILRSVDGRFRGDLGPARLLEIEDDYLCFDFNHPLSPYPVEMAVEIRDIHPAGDEHGGRCNDILEEISNGPGMQVRRQGEAPTDFLADAAFKRVDGSDDAYFYSAARMTNHLDSVALGQVQALYGRLLEPKASVLDLMSSMNSHLRPSLQARVTGLGMNREELQANPALDQRLVHDLNKNPKMPFPDASFDAVVCTVSVEYLTQPFAVFREVARVLRPGGQFIVSFSNRWFPPKAIELWHNLHEFERPALVLEYFLDSGEFESLETLSVRGLPRPQDDAHIGVSIYSDPLHAVWGRRRWRSPELESP
jgi:SAM-dependent methyltransferase